jgi:hypothetical protein
MVTSASAPNSQAGPSNPFSRAQIVSDPDADALLESTTGELALFRALTRVRPIGLHGFHILAIRAHVARDTGIFVPPESLWRKLGTCYDISNIQSYVRTVLFLIVLVAHPLLASWSLAALVSLSSGIFTLGIMLLNASYCAGTRWLSSR